MRSIGRSLLARRGRVLATPGMKRLSALSCLDLRKEIQNSARRNLRTKAIWELYIQEVCKRIRQHEDVSKEERTDGFTPTDISLIFASFALARKRVPNFIKYMLETTRSSINKYEIRDFAVLYNGLVKLGVHGDDMINSFSSCIETKLNAKTSEKDIALLLNALLELGVNDTGGVFVKSSLIISSRIKYITNCHTLTLLLYSYSRLGRLTNRGKRSGNLISQQVHDHTPAEHAAAPDTGYSPIINGNLRDTISADAEIVGSTDDSCHSKERDQSPEETLISETTLALLGRCTDLMIHMRPTDIMYFYKAAFNLVYTNSEGVTQHLYASLLNMHKAHIRIREHVLEFEARELISLLQTFQDLEKAVQEYPQLDADGALWTINNEVRNTVPALREDVTNELSYRSRVMSFADCLAFIKLIDANDHRGILVCRRLAYKLNKTDNWDRYQKAQLWDLILCLARRSVLVSSKDAQNLMVAVSRRITGTLKLREVELMADLAARLGAKSGALLKKIMSVPCRADCLQPSQAASILYHMIGLGYINHIEPILEACKQVDRPQDALKVLVAMAILKVNGLMRAQEALIQQLNKTLEKGTDTMHDESDTNKIALLRVAGLLDIAQYDNAYKVYPRLYALNRYVIIKEVCLGSSSKLEMDHQVMNLPQCTEEIAEELQQFVRKFDKQAQVHRKYNTGDMIVPIVLEFKGGNKVAVHVLMNDFYSGKRQMLRIDVYAQLKLMQQRGMRTVCCNAQEYLLGDRTQFIARLLERCNTAAAEIAVDSDNNGHYMQQQRKTDEHINNINMKQTKLGSFARLRVMVTDRGRLTQELS